MGWRRVRGRLPPEQDAGQGHLPLQERRRVRGNLEGGQAVGLRQDGVRIRRHIRGELVLRREEGAWDPALQGGREVRRDLGEWRAAPRRQVLQRRWGQVRGRVQGPEEARDGSLEERRRERLRGRVVRERDARQWNPDLPERRRLRRWLPQWQERGRRDCQIRGWGKLRRAIQGWLVPRRGSHEELRGIEVRGRILQGKEAR